MTVADRHPVSPLMLSAIEAGIPRPWFAVVEGAWLRKLRRNAGLSQERLAYRANVGVRTVVRLESTDESRCQPWTVARLAQALDLVPDVLARELVSAKAAGRGSD
jgi:transcriptional regulator with XRE-family HTH domain